MIPPLPAWWNGSDLDAKAAWLMNVGAARSYSDALSKLSAMRRKKPKRQPPVKARLPYADDECPSAGNYWDR